MCSARGACTSPASPWPGTRSFVAGISADPIRGMQAGDNVEIDTPPGGRCEYRPTEDAYPDGAAYVRENSSDEVFVLTYAKVARCIALGIYDDQQPMNPGGIGLDLCGVPVG